MDKKIFISFSSKDQAKADKVVNFLENNDYKCFISSRNLIAGKEYASQLIDNITDSTAVVLMLSQDSNESPHVLREVEYAVSKKIPIIVYTLEEVELSKSMKYYLMTHQWIPMNCDQNTRLLEGLKNISEGSEIPFAVGETMAGDKSKKSRTTTFALIGIVGLAIVIGIILLVTGLSSDSAKENGDANTTNQEVVATTDNTGATITETPITETQVVEDTTPAPTEEIKKEVELGQMVTFGNYLETPIEWIVLKDNTDTVTLVAKDILSMKCFDAAEGGEYGVYDGVDYFSYARHVIDDPELLIKVRGNNDWSKSNLRTWLNSDKGIVKYEDQEPCVRAVYNNPYDSEAGFLNGFSDAEKNAMEAVTIVTPVNSLNENAESGMILTTDYVYLLSSEELKLFEAIDRHFYAKPNEEAINQDKNSEGYRYFCADYETENYYYWLRDNAPEDYINMAYAAATEVNTDAEFISASVGACAYGVRPVITVKKTYFND